MKHRHPETAIIGRNITSYLYAFALLKNKKDVSLIDDRRIGTGSLTQQYLCNIEREMLRLWGEEYQIECLKNIDSYCLQKEIIFALGDHWIRLGKGAFENLIEILRKYPQFFDINFDELEKFQHEEFNQSMLKVSQRIALAAFKFKSFENINEELFWEQLPEELRQIFIALKKIEQVPSAGPQTWKNLVSALQFFYQQKMNFNLQGIETLHLVACLLSPLYQLDLERLLNDLKKEFARTQGQEKRTQVQDWFFSQSRNDSLILSSYEGVITPQKIVYSGAATRDFPLQFSSELPLMNGFYFEWQLEESVMRKLPADLICFSRPEDLAQDLGPWFCEKRENGVRFHISYPRIAGGRAKFYYHKALSRIEREMSLIFGDFCVGATTQIPVGLDSDQWVRVEKEIQGMKGRGRYNRFSAHYLGKAGEKKVRNIEYLGPIQGHYLGILGQMIELSSRVTRI